MRARLYDDYYVDVCVESAMYEGSFRNSGEGVRAYSTYAIRLFHEKLLAEPTPFAYIDGGANTGAFTLLAKHVPGSYVLSFEPNPLVRRWLQANIDMSGLGLSKRVAVDPGALWNKKGVELEFHPHVQQHGFSRLLHSFVAGGGGPPFSVTTTTLDSFSKNLLFPVRFIKLDVEGAELFAVRGATSIIEQYRPGILMEWYPPNCKPFGYHPETVDALMGSFGYSKEQVSATWVYYEYKEKDNGKEKE